MSQRSIMLWGNNKEVVRPLLGQIKSFLRSCSAPGAGTWSTVRGRGVGGVGGGGKHICKWELVVPVNTWSQRGNEMILFTCKSCASKTHCFSSTSHQKIGRHHLNSYFGCECSFSLQRHSGFTLNMNILCNLLQRGEKKCLWKTCVFLQREIIIHTICFTTKEAFHFKLQGRCWFPKSYWLKMAQLRSGRGAMNGDSRFSLPPFSSCELYCCVALKGGRGPSLHMVFFMGFKRQCCHSHTVLKRGALRGFISEGQWKQASFHCVLSAHMPQFALIAITGIPHHLVSSPEHETIDRSLITDKQLLSVVRAMQHRCQVSAYQYGQYINLIFAYVTYTHRACLCPITTLHAHTLTDNGVGGRNVIYLSI